MAGPYDFKIVQGETFTKSMQWTDDNNVPYDLTGFTGRMKLEEDDGTLIADLTTENGGMVIADLPTVGWTITLHISETDTTAMDFTTGVHDLELITGVVVKRLIQGKLKFDPNITTP